MYINKLKINKLFLKVYACLSIITLSIYIISCNYFIDELEPKRIIKIQTGTINDITIISCTAQGTIIDVGEGGLIQYGHCWSTTGNPTTDNEKTDLGSRNSVGTFSSNLTGLFPDTKYYVRAYGFNEMGAVYGNPTSFTTNRIVLPTVSTSVVTTITNNSATSGGNVISAGGGTVTARGVCWSTSQNPTLLNSNTIDGSETGSFSSDLTGLSAETEYFVRAYATNSVGTSFGQEENFTTLALPSNTGTITDSRDDQEYNIVEIGTQWWMAENLNIGVRIDGNLGQTDNSIIEKYCYDDFDSNGETFGGLYQWAEMMQYSFPAVGSIETYQGICPTGWHIPNDYEWQELEMNLGMSSAERDGTGYRGTDEGDKLKDPNLWISPDTSFTNESGFSAFSGGYRTSNGFFENIGYNAYFWTSSPTISSTPWFRVLDYYNSGVGRYDTFNMNVGLSVRCVKNP